MLKIRDNIFMVAQCERGRHTLVRPNAMSPRGENPWVFVVELFPWDTGSWGAIILCEEHGRSVYVDERGRNIRYLGMRVLENCDQETLEYVEQIAKAVNRRSLCERSEAVLRSVGHRGMGLIFRH